MYRNSIRDMGAILRAAIFDVDGVLLASPNVRAWREALEGFADPARFTSEMYEEQVAGKPVSLAEAVAVLGWPMAVASSSRMPAEWFALETIETHDRQARSFHAL